MTALSPDERVAVRRMVDERRRTLIDDAGGFAQVEAAERHATRGPTANGQFSRRLQNRLAAERLDVLESEQEPDPTVRQPALPLDEAGNARRNPTRGRTRRCGYCGLPSQGAVCAAHKDLL